ncbi:MAG: hypothetical protein HRU02_12665 [Myxococcales bacterium]|nr:hypothetical protein [Myxococcales bacterium]
MYSLPSDLCGFSNSLSAGDGPVTVYPVIEVGDLAAEFTPPFHIVTVASQTATVPIHFGWLLGGVMLGLGMKVLRNHPAP